MLDTLKTRVREQMDILKKEKAEADKDVEMKEESKDEGKKEEAKGD